MQAVHIQIDYRLGAFCGFLIIPEIQGVPRFHGERRAFRHRLEASHGDGQIVYCEVKIVPDFCEDIFFGSAAHTLGFLNRDRVVDVYHVSEMEYQLGIHACTREPGDCFIICQLGFRDAELPALVDVVYYLITAVYAFIAVLIELMQFEISVGVGLGIDGAQQYRTHNLIAVVEVVVPRFIAVCPPQGVARTEYVG